MTVSLCTFTHCECIVLSEYDTPNIYTHSVISDLSPTRLNHHNRHLHDTRGEVPAIKTWRNMAGGVQANTLHCTGCYYLAH